MQLYKRTAKQTQKAIHTATVRFCLGQPSEMMMTQAVQPDTAAPTETATGKHLTYRYKQGYVCVHLCVCVCVCVCVCMCVCVCVHGCACVWRGEGSYFCGRIIDKMWGTFFNGITLIKTNLAFYLCLRLILISALISMHVCTCMCVNNENIVCVCVDTCRSNYWSQPKTKTKCSQTITQVII